jgi:hypothetical protein
VKKEVNENKKRIRGGVNQQLVLLTRQKSMTRRLVKNIITPH